MKKILFFAFLCQFSYGQNAAERSAIKSTYDQTKVSNLFKAIGERQSIQENLIAGFKSKFRVKESDTNSLQRIYDGLPIYYTIYNDESVTTIKGSSLQPGGDLGLNLTGFGITAGVWDGGKVRDTHQELNGSKITFGDGSNSFSAHSTHVTGTIVGKGTVPRARGFAYQANAKTHFWDNDVSEMASFGSEGFLVSNHSYGYGINDSFPVSRFGYYDQTSADFDKIAEVFPYYQIVVAAGNSRNSAHPQIVAKGGFDMLTGSAVSKNIMVVAAVNSVLEYNGPSSVRMSSFSNYGPTDDGRIKPDISAKGVGVYSCNFLTDTTYETLSGTSMAAPAISGLIVLLQQHYKNLNTQFMKAATVRGLICHSADEAGTGAGPDYEYGWGLANGKTAANLISGNGKTSIVTENTLNNKVVFTKDVYVSASRPLSATICWTDPVPFGAVVTPVVADQRTPAVVNNLDIKIIDEKGTIYYPWKLDPSALFNSATQNSDNEVDNVEKVYIANAPVGKYTIQVSHKGDLLGGAQEFSLVAEGFDSLTLGTSDIDKVEEIALYPNPTQDQLLFNIDSFSNLEKILILDSTGKLVKSIDNNFSNSLNVGDLSAGLYFVKFMSNDSQITKKFIKE